MKFSQHGSPILLVFADKFHRKIPTGSHKRERQTSNKLFSSIMCQYLENGRIYVESYFNDYVKLHMRIRLVQSSMTLDDHELYKSEFSRNFARFRTFGRQQRLNE